MSLKNIFPGWGQRPYASAKLTGSRRVALSFALFYHQAPDKIHVKLSGSPPPKAAVGSESPRPHKNDDESDLQNIRTC